jgi:hypothetical protein
MRSEHVVAGAVGSATLASHFGASHEDHGPNVVLYRAGAQTARRAGSLRAMITRAKAAPGQSRSADLVPSPFPSGASNALSQVR